MRGPLSGTTVLEMASFISGPFAAMQLADLGAEVIKVEVPGEGDPFRGWTPGPNPRRPQFAAYNRGKRSVTINVRHEQGAMAYRRLASTVDVVIENFRPGTADRLGIGYDELRSLNPSLVYCAITGTGRTGPRSQQPTYDAIGQALSGLWSVLTDMTDPQPVGPAMSDQLTGIYAAQGVLAALLSRDGGGTGQRVDVNMLATTMAFMTEPVASYYDSGEISDLGARPRRSQSYAFLAGDAKPFTIHLSSPTKFWSGLVAVIDRPELLTDPRFGDRNARVAHYDELHDLLNLRFATAPRDHWLALLEAHDVPCAPINDIAEALTDDQARHIGVTQTFGDGDRAVKLVGFPVELSSTPCLPGRPPPDLGEHTDEVLCGLGYDNDTIERLRAEGAL